MNKAIDSGPVDYPVICIDRGNTTVKRYIIRGKEVLDISVSENLDIEPVAVVIEKYGVKAGIYCCVGHTDVRFVETLRLLLDDHLVVMSHSTPFPIGIEYKTVATLGLDRIAGIAGVVDTYGPSPAVLADAGTALTLDYTDGKNFKGGNISAGISTRLKALHQMTARLPEVALSGDIPEFGYDTSTALRAGACRGIAYEISGFFRKISNSSTLPVRLILTGGDAELIKKILKEDNIDCTVDSDIVGKGLAAILKYNEHEKK